MSGVDISICLIIILSRRSKLTPSTIKILYVSLYILLIYSRAGPAPCRRACQTATPVSNHHFQISMHPLQQLTFEQTMDYMDRGLSPRNIYPGLAAQGCYDTQGRLAGYYHGEEQMPQSEEKEEEAPTTTEEHQASETVDQIPRTEYPVATARENAQGRFDNNRQAQQSQSRQTQVASTISQNTQQQRGGMPSQNSRIKHPNPAAHGYNGGQRRWNGYSIEDERALQPQSLMAVGPSTANELMLPRYGGMQPQYPAMSATSSSGVSRLVPQANHRTLGGNICSLPN